MCIINIIAQQVGLTINETKTKVLTSGISAADIIPITLNASVLDEIEEFTYLGASCIATLQGEKEIHSRINETRYVFFRLHKHIWSRSEIRRNTKCLIYEALVRTTVLYSCETCAAGLHDSEVYAHTCLRRILKVRFTDRPSH